MVKTRGNNKTIASPKKAVKPKSKVFTLEDAKSYFNGLKLDDRSKEMYYERIKFLADELKAEDLATALANPTNVIKTIDNMTWVNDKSKKISGETKKLYYIALRVLTDGDKIPNITTQMKTEYRKAMMRSAKETEKIRGQNLRKSNLEKNKDLTFQDLLNKRKEFETSSYMTIKNLKALLIVSFYVLLPPRRLEYRYLQYYSKEPKQIEKGKCYLISSRQKTSIRLNEFKTRERKQSSFLPMFNKDLPKDLTTLIKQYVKKAKLKEGDYLFVNDKGDMYDDTAFSRQVQSAFQKVSGYKVGANDLRHLYITYVVDNIKKFNQNDLQDLAVRMGDMSVLTNIQYRLAEKRKNDDTITQIINDIQKGEQAQRQQEEDAESEGSVGNVDRTKELSDFDEEDEEDDVEYITLKDASVKDKNKVLMKIMEGIKQVLMKHMELS